MSDEEEWRPVVGWENLYEISENGQIRSLDREVQVSGQNPRKVKGRNLKPHINPAGYLAVGLSNKNTSETRHIHRMLAQAFIPNPEGLPYVRHLNDVKTDNRISNLAWGTPAQNSRDAVRNGVHSNSNKGKTECKRGHPLSGENVRTTRSGGRECLTCRKMHRTKNSERYLQEGITLDSPLHGTVSGYNVYGCRCGDCRDAKRVEDRAGVAKRKLTGLPEGDPRHGTASSYKVWSCRCDLCKSANTGYEKKRRQRRRSEQS